MALAVGALLSVFASAQPDGLERVASDRGFLSRTAERPLLRSPVADYLFPGIRNERLATGLSGFVGTLVLFAVGWLLGRVVTRSSRRTGGASGTPGRK